MKHARRILELHRVSTLPLRAFKSHHFRNFHQTAAKMTIIHMVFFKFQPETPQSQKDTFITEIKKLKDLPSVKGNRLIVGGGPSLTSPIEKSQGYEYALVSYHENLEKLEEYQVSQEHKWVTQTHFHPYKEDLVRFDFEVAEEDEDFTPFAGMMSKMLGKQ